MSNLNNNPRSNTHLMSNRSIESKGRVAETYRQSRRRGAVEQTAIQIAKRFAGTGRGGNLQWAEELCPRRRRRSIIRAKAKHTTDAGAI
jgi:hypothetical protein